MELKLSPETLEFLSDELEQMLYHCDLTETQGEEIEALLGLFVYPGIERFTLSK